MLNVNTMTIRVNPEVIIILTWLQSTVNHHTAVLVGLESNIDKIVINNDTWS